jgi:hypothetical protein
MFSYGYGIKIGVCRPGSFYLHNNLQQPAINLAAKKAAANNTFGLYYNENCDTGYAGVKGPLRRLVEVNVVLNKKRAAC